MRIAHLDDIAARACSSFMPNTVHRLAVSYGPRSSIACRLPPLMMMPGPRAAQPVFVFT